MRKAEFKLKFHNPDVLMCIANLSNDEVFTPPNLANKILDDLELAWKKAHAGEVIWENPNIKFLDPCTKSGVFLREITKRMVVGLEIQIPDLAERVNHILTKQLYGIAITELTSILTRRSLYCSKHANGVHSIAKSFSDTQGNIWFKKTEHDWKSERCTFCGASKIAYGREEHLETHAYKFIHSPDPKKLVNQLFGGDMHFDVIVGNPPYQMNDGGGEGSAAIPLYHLFVEQAKKLDPRFLCMIVPARWYSGGRGLNEFRAEMLNDKHIVEIHDYPETDLVFPGVNIRGGVCYFLRSKLHSGDTKVINYKRNAEPVAQLRPLLEKGLTTFVRYNEAISILKKVRALNEPTYDSRVQPSNPYGLRSNFSEYSTRKTPRANIILYRSRRGDTLDKEVYVEEKYITDNLKFKDKIKVLVSKASPGGDEYPHLVLGKPIIAPKNSVSTETYLIIDFPKNLREAENLVTYMETKLFRFLVSLIKNTQNIARGSFAFVPIQDLSEEWTDVKLFKKYKLNKEEIAFIDTLVKSVGKSQ